MELIWLVLSLLVLDLAALLFAADTRPASGTPPARASPTFPAGLATTRTRVRAATFVHP